MLTPILIVLPILLIAFLGWRHLSKLGKVPSLELGDGAKKFALYGVAAVVAGILLFGAVSYGLPDLVLSYLSWWPLVLISVLVVLFAFEKIRPFATVGIFLTVLIWVVTSIAMWSSDTLAGTTVLKTACASQHNLEVPENGTLSVTLCSNAMVKANSISVRRTGPKDVTIKFADSTIALYGDRLKGSSPKDFYFRRNPGHMGSNFFLDLIPNSDEFKKRGMSHIPLEFVIEYKVSNMPTN